MRRYPAIGDAPAVQGGLPIQVEAAAYFGRMTTAPSNAFKDAVNTAVYRWKRDGAWQYRKAIWVFAADTQQASLLNLAGNATYDATLTGTPTFTALKGFSNFIGGNIVNFGGVGSVVTGSTAALLVLGIKIVGTLLQSVVRSNEGTGLGNGAGTNNAGQFFIGGGDGMVAGAGSNVTPYALTAGGAGIASYPPASGPLGTGGSGPAAHTNPRTFDGGTCLQQLSFAAYFYDPAMTTKQYRKAVSTAAQLLEDLDALT